MATVDPHLLQYVLLFAAILGGRLLLNYVHCRTVARGFYWRASLRRWKLSIASLYLGALTALVCFELMLGVVDGTRPLAIWVAGAFALTVAMFPSVTEYYDMPKSFPTFQTLRTLINPGRELRETVKKMMEEDTFDWQEEYGAREFGLEPTEVRRRIRIAYEVYKLEIANRVRNHRLVSFDAGVYPAAKYYELLRHLGRPKVRKLIKNPPLSPRKDWDGNENRTTSRDSQGRRLGDSTELRNLVEQGRATKDRLAGCRITPPAGILIPS